MFTYHHTKLLQCTGQHEHTYTHLQRTQKAESQLIHESKRHKYEKKKTKKGKWLVKKHTKIVSEWHLVSDEVFQLRENLCIKKSEIFAPVQKTKYQNRRKWSMRGKKRGHWNKLDNKAKKSPGNQPRALPWPMILTDYVLSHKNYSVRDSFV